MNLKKRTLALIGLGYVGLPLAIEFGRTRPVIGFDIKAERTLGFNDGHEPQLEALGG
jgi:UDP-N-acetyl-D-galactosamine dehydrogenase